MNHRRATPNAKAPSKMRRTEGACRTDQPIFARSFSVPSLIRGASFRSRAGRGGRPRLSFDYLAKQRKFDAISKHLAGDKMDHDVLRSWLNENCTGGETALHRLVRYQPPARVVHNLVKTLILLEQEATEERMAIHLSEKMMKSLQLSRNGSFEKTGTKKKMLVEEERNSSRMAVEELVYIPEESRDKHGRTPLHVAVESGCHLKVIDRLLAGPTCTMPAIAKDVHGRCPLHWACMNPSGDAPESMHERHNSTWSLLGGRFRRAARHDESHSRTKKDSTSNSSMLPSMEPGDSGTYYSKGIDNMACVICRLAAIYPEATSIRDDDGFTPLDLAMLSDASESTLLFLRQAVKLYNRKFDGDAAVRSGTDGTEAETSAADELPIHHLQCCGLDFANDDVSSLGWDNEPPKTCTSKGKS